MSDRSLEAPFASKTVLEHALRGVGAVILLYVAIAHGAGHWLLAVAALGGALFLMRGCPTCWITGLFQTIQQRRLGVDCGCRGESGNCAADGQGEV